MKYNITETFDTSIRNERMMGPNAMRLAEEMAAGLPAGDYGRILDLGCGRGLSSVLLAKKYPHALIVAADLWIAPTENFLFFEQQGVADRVIPASVDATRPLPFAEGYFDLLFSVDSYHYFGHRPDVIQNLLPHIKNGGRLAVTIPGLKEDFPEGIPGEMLPYWQEDMNFYSCSWWKALWEAEPGVRSVSSREMDCCADAWREWLGCDNEYAVRDRDMMKAENGRYFNFVQLCATAAREKR